MNIAGIVAGGTGSRMGQTELPKQLLPLAGKPILLHTMERFLDSPMIDGIVVGIHKDWIAYVEELLQKFGWAEKPIVLAAGGANRNETLKQIVDCTKTAFGAKEDTILLTHDAVRPFVSQRMIEENLQTAKQYGVCTTVIPAVDTLLQSENDAEITGFPLRSTMFQVQTPQSFRLGLYDKVYRSTTREERDAATDVGMLFHQEGYAVKLVMGSKENFKITYPIDLKLAELFLQSAE